MTVKRRVEASENGEIPDARALSMGNLESADEAVACAQRVIDKSLASWHRYARTAESLKLGFPCYGEVPAVVSGQGLEFDPQASVHRRIRELTDEKGWQPRT